MISDNNIDEREETIKEKVELDDGAQVVSPETLLSFLDSLIDD